MEKVKVDKQFSLKVKDFLKGIYLAVIVPLLVTILEVIQAGSFNLDWESLGKIGVSALAAYLLKNFFTPSSVTIEGIEKDTVIKAAKGGDDDDPPVILYPPKGPKDFPDPKP